MRSWPDASVGAVITDPPYGVNVAAWDGTAPPNEYLTEALRISRGPVLWFSGAKVDSMKAAISYQPAPDRCIIWRSTFALGAYGQNGMYWRFHPIWCWRLPAKQAVICQDVIDMPADAKRQGFFHPGMKPLRLMQRLVKAFAEESVCDPFAGSGTTCVAAKRLGLQFVGIDISSDFCDLARRRLDAEDGVLHGKDGRAIADQGKLF